MKKKLWIFRLCGCQEEEEKTFWLMTLQFAKKTQQEFEKILSDDFLPNGNTMSETKQFLGNTKSFPKVAFKTS